MLCTFSAKLRFVIALRIISKREALNFPRLGSGNLTVSEDRFSPENLSEVLLITEVTLRTMTFRVNEALPEQSYTDVVESC